MTLDVPPDLWKRLTSTVGLVSVRHPGGTNVMAAEWSYLVNKQPLYAAVVLAPGAETRTLIDAAQEFSLTLCGEDQAELADFVGSFSITEIDKSATENIRFGVPEAIRSPWVTGGVAALECAVRQVVPLPVHTMYIAEVVAAHLPAHPVRPLVKHDRMYALGEAVQRTAIVAAAQLMPSGALRVAATGPVSDADWQITLLTPSGDAVDLGTYGSTRYGDLRVDLPVPGPVVAGTRVRVERDHAKPGHAVVSGVGSSVEPS